MLSHSLYGFSIVPMRILLITGSFPPMRCGVGDYAASLAEALGKLPGTQVAVLTDVKACTDRPDWNVEVFPIVHGWRISDLPQILKTVRQWAPDVVHIQYPTQGYSDRWLPWLLPILLLLFNITTVQTWHEHFPMGSLRLSLAPAITPGGLIVVRPNYKSAMSSWQRWLICHKQFQFIPNASAIPRLELSEAERSAIHQQFASLSEHLVVYFGFIYAHKGVDLLFEIVDPAGHHLVLIGEFNHEDSYHKLLLQRVQGGPWAGKVTITGFLSEEQAARVLAAADAVVLPFRDGGGLWNTSLHGAMIQGTFVLTTSSEQRGYDPVRNIYFAQPGDVAEMRKALHLYIGHRNTASDLSQVGTWEAIAKSHETLYRAVLN